MGTQESDRIVWLNQPPPSRVLGVMTAWVLADNLVVDSVFIFMCYPQTRIINLIFDIHMAILYCINREVKII